MILPYLLLNLLLTIFAGSSNAAFVALPIISRIAGKSFQVTLSAKKKSEWQRMMDEAYEKRLEAAAEARRLKRGEAPPPEKPKPQYVRPEDMNSSAVSIDWENQVRFESQQNGNRYAQNEILRKNLGGG
jgi:hypothetical protein